MRMRAQSRQQNISRKLLAELCAGEMDLLTIGTINDMYCEMQRDEEPHAQIASQDDFDRF